MLPAALANFTPVSASAQVTILSLLSVMLIVLNIVAHFRRKPPLDSELTKLNITIEGLKGSVDNLTKAHQQHVSHAEAIETLQREVAELRGHREKDLADQRKYTRESTERIFKRIDEVDSSVATNFQAVERALGQLEGRVAMLTK